MSDDPPPAALPDRDSSTTSGREVSGHRPSLAFAIAATIVTLGAGGVGVALGYFFAIARTQGGLGGGLGTVFAVVWVAAIASLLAVVGGLALSRRRTRAAGRISLMASAAVVAGAISASLVAPALGLRYEPPVVASNPPPLSTTTNGTVRLALASEPEFVAGSERGACTWSIDGGALSGIVALEPGTLRGRRLGVSVSPEVGLEAGTIVFSIEYDGLDDLGLPTWTGTVPMTSTDEGHAGAVDFTDLPIAAQKPEYPPDAAWPRTLTGTLSWTCD